EIVKAPIIDKLAEQEKKKKKDTKENECMERNIESIGREGDLSPRQINQLQGKNKKGEKLQTQSHINTRIKKGNSRRNHYSYIALLEPFQNPTELQREEEENCKYILFRQEIGT
ncbi:hypothetical protein H5410_028097, partial [Solanum commersonii]